MKRGNSKGKAAQVSVFIILGIILAAAGLTAYFITKQNPDKDNNLLDNEKEQAESYVSDCFNSVYKDSLDQIGIQGGYYREPLSEYLDTGYYNIPFYYFGGITYIPSKELIEEEIAYSINPGIFRCLNDISKYNVDYDFNYKFSNVTINEKEVIFTTDLELMLTKEGKTTKINFRDSPIAVKSNLMAMNNLGSYITYSYDKNKGAVCINCILEAAAEKGFKVEVYNNFKNVLMVDIIDNKTDNHPTDYSFLMTNLAVELNEPVALSPSNYSINMSEGNLNAIAPKI